MPQKYQSTDLVNFYAIYEAQNVDNATMYAEYNLVTNSGKFLQQMTSSLREGDNNSRK